VCDYVWNKGYLNRSVEVAGDVLFGRLDNTIGVGYLLRLRQMYGDKFWYVLTKYEEVGGLGARRFCEMFGGELDKKLIINIDISDDEYLEGRTNGRGIVAYCYRTTPKFVRDILERHQIEILNPRFNDSNVFERAGVGTFSFHIQIEQMHEAVEYADRIKVSDNFDLVVGIVDEVYEAKERVKNGK